MIEIKRKTKETDIKLKMNINGNGNYKINTPIGFMTHMLETFSKHSKIDLEIDCIGDTNVDSHHTIEDLSIVLGEALNKGIYSSNDFERFSEKTIIMEDARVRSVVDLSNRSYFKFFKSKKKRIFEEEEFLIYEHFFDSLINNTKINLHLICESGNNRHHIIECMFKSFGISLRLALLKSNNGIQSVKGVL